MTAMCRAGVFDGAGGFSVQSFAVPQPGPGEAVLRVEAVGMCHSDVEQLVGNRHVPGEVAPVVPGHEIVGRVHSLGDGASFGAVVGDLVAVDLVVRVPSSAENPHGLAAVYGYTKGVHDGHGLWGGYGEYMGVVPGTQLLKLTSSRPPEELTVFEPLASVVSWFDRCQLREGATVVIQGPGHMGLVAAAVARHRGAGTIIVTGTSADALRLAAARDVGADHTIDVQSENLVARVGEITRGAMADLVVDLAAGSVEPVRAAIEMARVGGTVLLAGLKAFKPVEIVSDMIVLKGLTIVGGSGSSPASMREAVSLLNQDVLPTEALRGEVYDLDGLEQALALLKRELPGRDAVRVGLKHR